MAVACGLAYLATGALFFFDPTRVKEAGSSAYWELLAEAPSGRTAFVAAFACTGLFALGVIKPIGLLLSGRADGVVHWAMVLAYVGYGVNTISYVRLLGGESRRAAAFAEGDPAVQETVRSFSLVLDPDGWLTFGAVGLFLAIVNLVAMVDRRWPRLLAVVGLASAVASWTALAGFVLDNDDLLSVAAGVGGVLLAPIWWFGIGRLLWRGPRRSLVLPSDQGPDVEERHGGPENPTGPVEHGSQVGDGAGDR